MLYYKYMGVDDFISNEQRQYRFRIGTVLASSLAGFVAGIIFGGMAVWLVFWALSQSR